MTTLLTCNDLSFVVGDQPLFQQIQFSISLGDKIALVGHNGSGKSSLLSLINGQLDPLEGEIVTQRQLHLETVEQFLPQELESLSLFEAVAQKISTTERYSNEYKVELLLEELGFASKEFPYLVKDLSGGQQNRLMFARAIINEPALILFDEPTNHLDIGTTLFFENYLKNSLKSAFIVISHDRQLLDSVTNRTLFLRDRSLYSFNLPYTQACEKLRERDESAAKTRKEEEKKIQSLRVSAKRLATWGKVYDNEDLARKAKTMEKRIERMEGEKTFVTKGSSLKLSLEVNQLRSDLVASIEDSPIFYQKEGMNLGDPLYHIEKFYIRPGDRVALLGANGAGKTTLIRSLVNGFQNPEQRIEKLNFNPQCKIGYYDQEQELLSPEKNLIEILRDGSSSPEDTLKKELIHAGFAYKDHDKKVEILSGGEKARLMFILLKLNRPNFLILDEPTNHIDIQGKEHLEEQLLESEATVLITSHDRRFVDKMANRYFLIQDKILNEIHDPEEFYRRQLMNDETGESHENKRKSEAISAKGDVSDVSDVDEDALLEKICELEEKLEADLKRKPKHQVPRLQKQWQEEIQICYQQLETLEKG